MCILWTLPFSFWKAFPLRDQGNILPVEQSCDQSHLPKGSAFAHLTLFGFSRSFKAAALAKRPLTPCRTVLNFLRTEAPRPPQRAPFRGASSSVFGQQSIKATQTRLLSCWGKGVKRGRLGIGWMDWTRWERLCRAWMGTEWRKAGKVPRSPLDLLYHYQMSQWRRLRARSLLAP